MLDVTREHITLPWLHQRTWTFAIPDVLHHAEYDGMYYIVFSQRPGETVDSIWPTSEASTRQHYAERMVEICRELALPTSRCGISGVDGNVFSERCLCGRKLDHSPQNSRQTCMELDMDWSTLVFYHCDVGPTNILAGPANGSIEIIEGETAGFVPVESIRTKSRVSSGMKSFQWRRI